MAKQWVYRTDADVLLNLQRSQDLMNCAQLILGFDEECVQKYVPALIDVAAYLAGLSTDALDLGEQTQTQGEQGVCSDR